MDIKQALEILEIDLNSVKLTNLTHEYIRKKYHKLALINHPDKNGDTVKFQQINEAYEYLSKELHIINGFKNVSSNSSQFPYSKTFEPTGEGMASSNRYIYFLSIFIESIIQGNYKEVIKNVIKEIVTGYKQLSLEKIFEELDKDSALEVYSFICKYKHILYISNDTLEFVSLLINQKYKNDRVFILNPSLKDLLENNIFKLYVDDRLYLVPLWHNELYFDSPEGDIIVICNPELPANILLDEDNNIYVEKEINFSTELLDLIKNNGFVSLTIGENSFSIPVSQLYMKKDQIYKMKGQGISQVLENDIYNVSCKSNIIVKIRIIY
jgi:hypothetical protein